MSFGRDDFVLTASPAWQLPLAHAKLISGGREVAEAEVQVAEGAHQLRFPAPQDWGTPFMPEGAPDVSLVLTYPDETTIRLSFGQGTYASSADRSAPLVSVTQSMRVATIDVDATRLSVHTAAYGPVLESAPLAEGQSDQTGS